MDSLNIFLGVGNGFSKLIYLMVEGIKRVGGWYWTHMKALREFFEISNVRLGNFQNFLKIYRQFFGKVQI